MNNLLTLDYTRDKKKITLITIGVAVLSFIIVFSPYFFRGNTFVWFDGYKQHATFLEYFTSTGWLGGIGEYDFNIGLGADYLFSFAYYMIFDPFIIFYFMFFRLSETFAYSVMVSMKLFAIFTVMFVYLKHRGVKPIVAIICSVCYMASGVAIFSVPRHPMFATGMIYLPLMWWGVERIVTGGGETLFIHS